MISLIELKLVLWQIGFGATVGLILGSYLLRLTKRSPSSYIDAGSHCAIVWFCLWRIYFTLS